MSKIIEDVSRRRVAGVTATGVDARRTVADSLGQREDRAADTVHWSFEQAFEQACADVQTLFRGRHEAKGLLLIGLGKGLLVATPFAWASEGEKAEVYERLSRDYQGRAEYYIHATSGWRGGARVVTVVGMNREQTTLSRCWQIKQDPVPRLVEHGDVPSRRETLPGILFSRFRYT